MATKETRSTDWRKLRPMCKQNGDFVPVFSRVPPDDHGTRQKRLHRVRPHSTDDLHGAVVVDIQRRVESDHERCRLVDDPSSDSATLGWNGRAKSKPALQLALDDV